MKKNILLTFILTWILLVNNVFAESNKTHFIVTAYYSPLPDQEHYSYSVYTKRERTYEEEKRLQWKWIKWASWKKVFSWMLAAPKNYKFWTKIYLEWLGVWEVADRWGAIVNKWVRWHWYDRIDVWMWYGDEWLKRATYWGKRTIKWEFLSKNSDVSLDYTKIPSPNWVIKSESIKKKIIVKKEIDVFSKKLTTKYEFIKLQEVLTDMNLYTWALDWDYKSVIDVIYDFQLKNKIIKWVYSPWAGSYWPITRSNLAKKYKLYLQKKEEERLELVKIQEEKEKEEARKKELEKKYIEYNELAFNKADLELRNIWNPKFWDISHSVRNLQVKLKQLGYFNYKDTAIYWNITKESIIAYQIDKNIIKSKNDLWAWIFWPKTKHALKDDLKKQFFKEIVRENSFNFNELAFIKKEWI